MNQRGNRRTEVAAIRGLLAGAVLDLEALRLERTLRRKFSEDQPRAPAGQPDGGQWVPSGGGGQGVGGPGIGGRSDGADGDVAHREQTVLDDGTRVLSLRIRAGRRDYDEQDIVTAPDGQSRIFETSGLTQTIRDGETGAVLGRSTFTAAGAEPEAFAQPAFLQTLPLVAARAKATIELALALYAARSARFNPYSRTVLGLSAQEFLPNPKGSTLPVVWVGSVNQRALDAACKRNGQVEAITNQVARNVRASGQYRTPQGYGTQVHLEIDRIVTALNDPDFRSEISFDRQQLEVPYGQSGSVRLDLLERGSQGTTCIYDYKTLSAVLEYDRAVELATMASRHFPGTVRIIVIQVKPR